MGNLPKDLNGQVSFYAELLIDLIQENPLGLRGDSVRMDADTVLRRMNSEGFPFATKRLPLLAKALESALEDGQFQVPFGFKRSKRSPGLPAFLQDALLIIFDVDGRLRPVVDWTDFIRSGQHLSDDTIVTQNRELDRIAHAVSFVRQVCYFLYKLDLPFEEELVERAIGDFVSIDEQLPDKYDDSDDVQGLLKEAAYQVAKLWKGLDLRSILPSHGPGAVATGEIGHQKWTFRRTYDGLSDVYGLDYFTVGGSDELADRKDWHDALDHLPGGAAALCIVPKDSRGPRLISMEPLEYQFIQQGQKDALVPLIERNSRYRVNFIDQKINASLALSSSKTRRYATLDLKEASDRVSYALFEALCPEEHRAYLDASRSAATVLPNGEAVVLKKFAPMGSAVCFPVESSFFWAIAVAAISRVLPGRQRWVRRNVYTYGDDLIVPREYARCVMDALEMVGLKVNRSKSFVHGFFRESCGTDALSGVNVTPVRCKKLIPVSRKSVPASFQSACDVAANLKARGYVRAGERIYARIESIIGTLPFGGADAPFLCRREDNPQKALLKNLWLSYKRAFRARYNAAYQRWEFLVFRLKTVSKNTELDGWERLLRSLLAPTQTPDQDPTRKDLKSLVRRWGAL